MRPVWLLLILALAAAATFYFFPDSVRQLREQLPDSALTHRTDRVYKWQNARGDWQITDTPPPAGIHYERQDYRDDVNVLPVPPGIDPDR
jgi:hypothetical protein